MSQLALFFYAMSGVKKLPVYIPAINYITSACNPPNVEV